MHFVLSPALWFLSAVAPFTERGKTDFDTFLQLLNPYGTWKQVDGQEWRYFPLAGDRFVPMSSGTWVYTDFGWYWQGDDPFSWATDHYGVWKLGTDGVWSWLPDPLWQACKVDFRETKTHVGWRSSAIDQFGEFVEKEETQRFAHPEEWVFVSKEKFKGPFTRDDVVTGADAAKLLQESTASTHTFVSWREMDRLGPDPSSYLPPDHVRKVEDLKENEPEFITPTIWTLPTFWTPPPPDAKPGDIYVYRPHIAQDTDGVQRRVLIWERPGEQEKATQKVQQVLNPEAPTVVALPDNPAPVTPSNPVAPATPATSPVPTAPTPAPPTAPVAPARHPGS